MITETEENMVQTLRYSTEYGTFFYKLEKDTLSITGFEGNHGYVIIPSFINISFDSDASLTKFPVTQISDKAFFNQRSIEKLMLPETIREIGDWAFSHMANLKSIAFPNKEVTIGKQIFMDSPILESISVYDASKNTKINLTENQSQMCSANLEDPGLPYYLMASLLILKNQLLFTPESAGSEDWYASLDQAIENFLIKPDDADFEPVFYGWFNDEDEMDTQYPEYIKKIQKHKASFCLKRLRNPIALSQQAKEVYLDYIRNHFSQSIWPLICTEEYFNDLFYISFLLEQELIHEKNIDECINDLVDCNASEATVLLLNQKNKLQKNDFFAAFDSL